MQATTSDPTLLILGFEDDVGAMKQLAELLDDLGVAIEVIDRRLSTATLAERVAGFELIVVVVAHPESAGADLTRTIDRIVAERGRERVIVAVPQGTFSAALLDLDRKRGIPLLDLGRRIEPGSEATRRLRKRVALALIGAEPLDLPASLYRTAIHQRSVEILAENLTLAASRPIRDWELARLGDEGPRPNPLWSSWLIETHEPELARLAQHLDELRVQQKLGDEREGKP
ncbi:hypothetical protein ACNOYE_30340 [Nannocystaceae bacterium ST9]